MAISIFEGYEDPLADAYGRMFGRLKDITERMAELEYGQFSRLNVVRFEIAKGLYIVHRDKLWMVSGYKNFDEYAFQTLKYNKVTANNYVRVGKNFICKDKPVSIFADGDKDFNISQLVELLKLSPDEIRECMKQGRFSYDTAALTIRAIVLRYKQEQREDETALQREAVSRYEAAWDRFHEGYNGIKALLECVGADQESYLELLSLMMDSGIYLFEEGRKAIDSGK